MRRVVSAALVCAFASLFAASGQASVLTPRIVGGSDTTIELNPWQVAVETADDFFCGGVILDTTHVLTAAHCVLTDDDPTSAEYAPGDLTVISGTTHIYDTSLDPTTVKSAVAKDVADPMYDGTNYDAAIITLATPLVFDAHRSSITLEDADASPATGTPVTVSGWGILQEHSTSLSNPLQKTTVAVTDFNQCKQTYAAENTDLIAGAVLCAGAQLPPRDSCSGDSGGPLINPADQKLVGIVSSGIGCAEAQFPGIYTSMTNADVRQFIDDQTGVMPPTPGPALAGAGPSLTGGTLVGQTLQCSPGVWSGNPTFTYAFASGSTSLQSGNSSSYALTAADIGRSIVCQVHAANPHGSGDASSAPVGPVTAPVVVQQTPPPVQAQVIPPRDTTPPGTTITSAKCTRTQCVLHVTATDTGFSAGVAGLRTTVRDTTTKPCIVKHKRRTCTHVGTRTLKATPYINGRFVIVASKLPFGKHRFSITAVDTAGNIQSVPTTKTTTTKKATTAKK